MLLPIRQTIQLSGGAVTLRAWPATVADGLLWDLLTLTGTLGHLRDAWGEYTRADVEPGIWAAFWRLTHASLEAGSTLPEQLTWNDRLTLMTAMYDLNSVEEAEGKLQTLTARAQRLLNRARAASQNLNA